MCEVGKDLSMRYREIIESQDPNSIMSQVRNAVVDILTPLVSNGITYVTVQQVLDKLKNSGTGVDIDRSMLMQILNPDQVKLVSSIEGDRVNLNNGDGDSQRAITQNQKQKEQDNIKDTAQKQAKKEVSDT
jgi:hypothetical protein